MDSLKIKCLCMAYDECSVHFFIWLRSWLKREEGVCVQPTEDGQLLFEYFKSDGPTLAAVDSLDLPPLKLKQLKNDFNFVERGGNSVRQCRNGDYKKNRKFVLSKGRAVIDAMIRIIRMMDGHGAADCIQSHFFDEENVGDFQVMNGTPVTVYKDNIVNLNQQELTVFAKYLSHLPTSELSLYINMQYVSVYCNES